MMDNNNQENNGNNYADFGFYHSLEPSLKKRKKGPSWVTIALVALVAFLVGALVATCLIFFNIEAFAKNYDKFSRIIEETEDWVPPSIITPSSSPKPSPTPIPTERPLPKLGSSEPINPPITGIKDIVKHMSPSVVGIVLKEDAQVDQQDGNSKTIEIQQGTGSGMVLTEDGYIVTNSHVVANASYVYVYIDGEYKKATVMGDDPFYDVAVIKIDAKGLKPITIGNSSAIEVGETAVAVGFYSEISSSTFTAGIISAVDRSAKMSNVRTVKMIQTDAPINPGNSGGALVNDDGQVIGMNVMKYIYAGVDENGNPIPAEGMGFALPINEVIEIAKQLIQFSKVDRPGIGIVASELDSETADIWDYPPGIIIMEVTPKGAADVAGLKADDVITAINGEKPGKLDDFVKTVSSFKLGDSIQLSIWRQGDNMEITVKIGDMNDMERSSN